MASEITPGQKVLIPASVRVDQPKYGAHAVVVTDGKASHHRIDLDRLIPIDDLREVLRRISHVAEALHDLEQTSSPYDGERTLSDTGTPFLVVESEYLNTIKAELTGANAISRALLSQLGGQG